MIGHCNSCQVLLLLLLLAAALAKPRSALSNLCDSVGQPAEPVKVKGKLQHRAIISKVFKTPQYLNVTINNTATLPWSIPPEYNNIRNSLSKNRECFSTGHQVCKWFYCCDTDEHRFPQNLMQAELSPSTSNYPIVFYEGSGMLLECSCIPVTAPINVLKFNDCVEGEEEWSWETIPVRVGFVCAPHI